MADPGSVSYQFSRKGVIVSVGSSEDALLEATLEFGVEDIDSNGEGFVITCEASSLVDVRQALQAAGIDYESADVEFVSSLKVEANLETADRIIKLVDALEDLDDVQDVYTNMDISQETLEQLGA